MAKATKIIVIFDDGTTFDVPADSAASIFLKESAAVHCGHQPPYGKPPKKEEAAMLTAMSAPTGSTAAATTTGGTGAGGTSCYMINGVIICV